jgi:hypothetical protein
MKHDFREHPSGDEDQGFLVWLENETTDLLRRSYRNGEATKGAIFLFVNRAFEAHMTETGIAELFGRCIARAGFPSEEDEATFAWLEHFCQIAAKGHRDSGREEILDGS